MRWKWPQYAGEPARPEDADDRLGERLAQALVLPQPGWVGDDELDRTGYDAVAELPEVHGVDLEVLGERRGGLAQEVLTLHLEPLLVQRPHRGPALGCIVPQVVEDLSGDPGHSRVLDAGGGVVVGLAVPPFDVLRCPIVRV